jgi:hypothetical protein
MSRPSVVQGLRQPGQHGQIGVQPHAGTASLTGASELPLVDDRPVERLKLPARFAHNRRQTCCGKVVKMTLADNDGEVDEGILKSGESVVHIHGFSVRSHQRASY